MRLSSHGSNGVDFRRLGHHSINGAALICSFPPLQGAAAYELPPAHVDRRERRNAGHLPSNRVVDVSLRASQLSGDLGNCQQLILDWHSSPSRFSTFYGWSFLPTT